MAGTLVNPFITAQPFVSGNQAAKTDVQDFGTMIHRMYSGGEAPLFALLSELGSGEALNIEHGYWQKFMLIPSVTIGAAAQIAGDTTWTVLDSTQLIPGHILRVPSTGENVRVTSVVSGTSITVARAFGITAAAGVPASTVLQVIGTAFEEASTRPNAQSFNPAYIKNYTQIFRNAWAVSGSAAAIQMLVGEGNVSENKQDCVHFHSASIEQALFWGQLYSGTLNNRPVRAMDGLASMIGNAANYPPIFAAANVFTAAATTNFTQLEAMLEPSLNQRTPGTQGGTTRTVFTGAQGIRVFNQIGRLNGMYELVSDQTIYGLQFRTFRTSRGTFNLIEHPMFNSSTTMAASAFVLDLSALKLCYLGGRKTLPSSYGYDASGQNVIKVPDNGQDAIGGDLLTEVTLENINIPSGCYISGLTAGAAG